MQSLTSKYHLEYSAEPATEPTNMLGLEEAT